jgi:PTH1 family peptidyl-tRNA hydrolase
MYLIVGLGNPGARYFNTRHNIGFSVVDIVAAQWNLSFASTEQQALVVETVHWQSRIMLVKPGTYMNASGAAVCALADIHAIPPARILVIHDDIDLPLGRIKIVAGGGAGGHKGISSLINCLGTNKFPRIKIGIGRPQDATPVVDHVLSRFTAAEQAVLADNMERLVLGIRLFVEKGIMAAMNHSNRL